MKQIKKLSAKQEKFAKCTCACEKTVGLFRSFAVCFHFQLLIYLSSALSNTILSVSFCSLLLCCLLMLLSFTLLLLFLFTCSPIAYCWSHYIVRLCTPHEPRSFKSKCLAVVCELLYSSIIHLSNSIRTEREMNDLIWRAISEWSERYNTCR